MPKRASSGCGSPCLRICLKSILTSASQAKYSSSAVEKQLVHALFETSGNSENALPRAVTAFVPLFVGSMFFARKRFQSWKVLSSPPPQARLRAAMMRFSRAVCRSRIPLIAPKESAGGSEELEQRHASDAEIGTREGVGRGASGKRPRPKLMPLDILVVDDNVDAATALGKLLEARGHDVMLCHDGASTLTSAESFKPDAIFIDIGLPDMSGYEVARELRKRGSPSALIALTGYGQESDKAKAREAGFAYHLTKPVSLAQIEEALAIVTASP